MRPPDRRGGPAPSAKDTYWTDADFRPGADKRLPPLGGPGWSPSDAARKRVHAFGGHAGCFSGRLRITHPQVERDADPRLVEHRGPRRLGDSRWAVRVKPLSADLLPEAGLCAWPAPHGSQPRSKR